LDTAGWDQSVKIGNAVIGQEVLSLNGNSTVAWSWEGKRLASAGADNSVIARYGSHEETSRRP
jgi:hypothetical protein